MDKNDWYEDRLLALESEAVKSFLGCASQEAVEATISYARFLAKQGVTPETFPAFLRLLEARNHWVVDALVGRDDPFEIFSAVQPNDRLVQHIFAMLDRWRRGSIYSKNLAMVLGVLRTVYTAPHVGYNLHAVSLAEVNCLGKHLDEEKGQDDPVNRAILACLDRLSSLENADDPEQDSVASQAAAIRNAFFDDHRTMIDVLPDIILESGEELKDIRPRKVAPYSEDRESAAEPSASAQDEKKPVRKTPARRTQRTPARA